MFGHDDPRDCHYNTNKVMYIVKLSKVWTVAISPTVSLVLLCYQEKIEKNITKI